MKPDLRIAHPLPFRPRLLALTLVAMTLSACGPQAATPGATAAGMPPPPPVGVITVAPTRVTIGTELPGRLEALRSAQVRARVAGIVQKRLFVEGSLVKAGQPLFTLDSGSWRAALITAEATVARADAAVAQAQAQVERYEPLVTARAISQQEWLATQTALKQVQAEAAGARAGVSNARINLGYATITAPIAGRIGRAQQSEGALVGPADPTPLALIQQTDALYINFTQSAGDVMKLRREIESGKLRRVGQDAVEVRVVLEDGSVYPQPAKLLFADPTVDAATGQLTLRAEVPNPGNTLLPGLFVKVRFNDAVSDNAVLVPQQAVTRDVGGDTVQLIGPDNKPVSRTVKIGGASPSALGTAWVVLEGLAAGDRVIVDGFQKMRPGAPVTPVPWTPGAPAAPSAPGAAKPPGMAASAAPAASASAPASAASR